MLAHADERVSEGLVNNANHDENNGDWQKHDKPALPGLGA
jgi:hypothetical protein